MQQSSVNQYQLSSGSAEVLIEVVQPLTHLVIFGAGSDAIPVLKFAKAPGWRVTVVDCRATYASRERFWLADNVILSHREILKQQVSLDAHSVVVVMTHNYLDDLKILKLLLPSKARYVGVLGPKHRTERLLQELSKEKMIYPNSQLQKWHSPIGLDIGADTPEEIAIAIIAEIQAVLTKRSGGLLRNRTKPIHQRHEVKTTQIEWEEKLLVADG